MQPSPPGHNPWEPLPSPPARHPEFYRVLVCGSRRFSDGKFLERVLEAIRERAEARGGRKLLVIQGEAPGADSLAQAWADGTPGVLPVSVPAPWHKLPPGGANGAGQTRNRAMAALSPDLVVAFYADGAENYGTRAMVKHARSIGLPVKEFTR